MYIIAELSILLCPQYLKRRLSSGYVYTRNGHLMPVAKVRSYAQGGIPSFHISFRGTRYRYGDGDDTSQDNPLFYICGGNMAITLKAL